MPKSEVLKKTDELLKQKWLRDLQASFADKVNPDNAVAYIGETIDKLA